MKLGLCKFSNTLIEKCESLTHFLCSLINLDLEKYLSAYSCCKDAGKNDILVKFTSSSNNLSYISTKFTNENGVWLILFMLS